MKSTQTGRRTPATTKAPATISLLAVPSSRPFGYDRMRSAKNAQGRSFAAVPNEKIAGTFDCVKEPRNQANPATIMISPMRFSGRW